MEKVKKGRITFTKMLNGLHANAQATAVDSIMVSMQVLAKKYSKVENINEQLFQLTIQEGFNEEIAQVFETVDEYKVKFLSVGNLALFLTNKTTPSIDGNMIVTKKKTFKLRTIVLKEFNGESKEWLHV